MRVYEYLQGILGSLGVGDDNGVPTPAWRIEEYLAAIYGAIKNGPTISGAYPGDVSSGAVASFADGADMPFKSLTAAITPVQDLHGYDHPWPAGGAGVDIIPSGTDPDKGFAGNSYLNDDGTTGTINAINISEYFPVKPSTVYRLTKTGTQSTISASVCFYDSDKVFLYGEKYNNRQTFTVESPSTAAFARVSITTSDTTITFWENANICPITGWTAANIHIAGKNLLPELYTSGYKRNNVTITKNADGSLSFSGIADSDTYFYINRYSATGEYDFEYPSANYKLSSGIVGGASAGYRFQMTVYDKKTHAVKRAYVDIGNGAYVAVGENETEAVYLFVPSGKNMDGITLYPMLTFASETDQTYEPYKGDTYNVDWTSDAGTVYGGTVDVVSGVLRVRPEYDSYNGETLVGPWLSSMDVYEEGATPTTGAQVVDLGGTETEYQLIPQQVKTLLGTNNIWANTGDVSVDYLADTSLYVEKKAGATEALLELIITANREPSMKASTSYSAGALIIVDGKLYKASTSIASGATLTVGTNVTQTTVAAEIAALS